jgi:hypothetical protein
MQNPNEDTEWNDVLRQKGIIPAKPKKEAEITEDQIVSMVEAAAQKHMNKTKDYSELSLEEIEALEDEEDEKIVNQYRQQRLQEMRDQMSRARYGDVREITAEDYVQEVNKAGEGIWVVLHLYQHSLPICKLLNEYMQRLAAKHPQTKFLKSIATLCIPNYPDRNLPTIFIYRDGELVKQWIKEEAFTAVPGAFVTEEEFEWMLHEAGAVKSKLTENPKLKRANQRSTILLQNKGVTKGGDSDDSDDE